MVLGGRPVAAEVTAGVFVSAALGATWYVAFATLLWGLGGVRPLHALVAGAAVPLTTAVHEAGHVVAGLVRGLQPTAVRVGAGGATCWTDPIPARDRVWLCLAGPAAATVAVVAAGVACATSSSVALRTTAVATGVFAAFQVLCQLSPWPRRTDGAQALGAWRALRAGAG